MSTLKFVYKVTRIEQCLIAGLSTWLIALLSNGPLWFNEPKVAAGVCMFFGCMGASVFHYGRRHDVYAKKWYDLVIITRPTLLMWCGGVAFAISIGIAIATLPAYCVWITVANCAIILLYANFLDQFWPFKNVAIALVCVTPIVMGWYSGHRLHPVVPYLILAIFCAYLAREILKDIEDRDANHGKRFTMVMSLGIPTCQRIAAALLVSTGVLLLFGLTKLNMPDAWLGAFILTPYGFGIVVLMMYARLLYRGGHLFHYYRVIDAGMVGLMAATLALRTLLY